MHTKIPCPVCGKYQFEEECDYDICEYCGWENDSYTEEGGANTLSLEEYKERYKMYLALNPDYKWKQHGFPPVSDKEKCRYWLATKKDIESSHKCGCFFCSKIFDSSEISKYRQAKNGENAIYPYCGVDSVFPDSKVDITPELLKYMYKIWFE